MCCNVSLVCSLHAWGCATLDYWCKKKTLHLHSTVQGLCGASCILSPVVLSLLRR
jgi:hypothetical protein